MSDIITLAHGGGGAEMNVLIKEIRKRLGSSGNWSSCDDDSAVHDEVQGKIVFTSDSYVITPQFFPGGNIGDVAFCGTLNDLAVMGAKPLGISLALILEEGLSKKELFTIIDAIASHSKKTGVPVVTGDTKVMEKGGVDKIVITTSGVGAVDFPLTKKLDEDDVIIVSGGLAEHSCSLLAKRYEMETPLISDVKPLIDEILSIKKYIKLAKDLTRGGLAAALNEIADKHKVELSIEEESLPLKKEVKALTSVLGIEVTSLACEGRFVCLCKKDHANTVLSSLKEFNSNAAIIGRVQAGTSRVVVKTRFGKKLLPTPSGTIVPRIC